MAADRTLIRIRERSFPDLLDLSLLVVRSRPKTLGIAALAGVAPFAALNAWLSTDPDFPMPAFLGVLAMEAPWATAPLTLVLGGLMFGDRPTAREVFRAMLRGLPSMILYQVLIRGMLLVTVVLYPIVPAKLAFVDEVILLERSRMFKVPKRSSILSGLRGTDLFGQWLAQLLVGGLFVICFWAGTGAIVNALTSSELTWDDPSLADVFGLRFQLAVWLAVSYFGVVRFFTYIDQRIRLEGWEVKQRLVSAARAIEEAGRW